MIFLSPNCKFYFLACNGCGKETHPQPTLVLAEELAEGKGWKKIFFRQPGSNKPPVAQHYCSECEPHSLVASLGERIF